jgi:hypothetical protein
MSATSSQAGAAPAAPAASSPAPKSGAPAPSARKTAARRGPWRRAAGALGRLIIGGFELIGSMGRGVRGFVGPRVAWVLVRAVQPMLPKLIVHLVQTRRLDRLEKLQSTGISLVPALRESVRRGDVVMVEHLLRRDVQPDPGTLSDALRAPSPRAEPVRSLLRHHVKPPATALDMALGTANDELAGALLNRGVAPGPRVFHWIPIRRVEPMPDHLWLRLIENLDPKYLSVAAFERMAYIAPTPALELALKRTTHEKSECRRVVFEAGIVGDRPEMAQYALSVGQGYSPEYCMRILAIPHPAPDGTLWGARLGRALELLAATQQQLTLQQGYRALEHIYVNEPTLLGEHRVALNQVLTRVVAAADLVQLNARADDLARASTVGLRFADLAPVQSPGGPWISTFEVHGKHPGSPAAEVSPGLNGVEPHVHPVEGPHFAIH